MRLVRWMRGCLLALTVMLVAAPVASAIDDVNTKRLRDAVTVSGILAHERAFSFIANANNGVRTSGTPGFDASAAYVRGRLERAGYTVSEQSFEFPFFEELAPSTFAQVTPNAKTYSSETDFATFQYSGSGDVTAKVVPVDLTLPPTPEPSSTSGCEAEDFAGFPAGAIALIQRGTCTFGTKVANAKAAGAAAVLIFNEGQEGRQEKLEGTLGEATDIPALGTSFAVGQELAGLAAAGDVTAKVTTSTRNETRTTKNVIADSKQGDPDKTVVVGAHLDSVAAGPGINDNGSGSATDLEVAEEIAKLNQRPRNRLRFAFWGAEEEGLLGSQHYVDNLGPDGVADIALNLNFDMLASPNYVRFVYDGDGSDTETAGPPGSAEIEKVFTDYFTAAALPTEPTAFDGRSDYGPFIDVGIPAGGLFSGAEGIKTAEEAQVYGGTAGAPYDACYHQACDDINNLNTKGLGELSDGVAHATWTFGRTRTGLFEQRRRGAAARVRGLAFHGEVARR